MDIPIIEQVKIQARVLVPLIKAMRAVLGAELANAIAQEALGPLFRKYGRDWWQKHGSGKPEDKLDALWKEFAAGDALDYEIVRRDAETYDLNVTGCRYAKFFETIGEPELGFLLVCSGDALWAEGAGIELTLSQTIMQGASHCEFRYRLQQRKGGG